ncbi:MAG TPA: galactose oxidase-like domain-containing protein [Gemmatimonadales bacterium]|nr:galactose oxidase-like domain-containing protein [Gemmatimonadales bacterium]
MRRRDFIKSAALVSTGAVAGLGGLLQFSGWATAAGSNRLGAWSSGLGQPLAQWPLIPIHAVLLGNGQLLTYGTGNPDSSPPRPTQQTGYFIYDVWEPRENSHFTLPNTTGTDIFCSAQIILPQSGNVLIAGGDNFINGQTTNTGNDNSNIFDPSNNTLNLSNHMNRPRWYGSTTTLPDGRIYIQGGTGGNDRPEIRELDGTFRLLSGVDTSSLFPLYPRNRVAPDGRLFGYSDRTMYYVDPNAAGGNGSITFAGVMPSDGPSGWTSTDVMYAPGKILRCGGGSNALPEEGDSVIQAKNAAAVIDINGATPIYKKMASMPVSLHWANATVLADGNVVVTGGSLLSNVKNGVNTTALLWRADTGGWTKGARSTPNKSRLYHSVALLLPDGSVLSGGGGAPGPEANTDAEIYYPPYLFTKSGAFASRPTITSSPGHISYGQNFEVRVSSAARIQRVTFIKTGSVTHSHNFEQRFMELAFTTGAAGVLDVRAPSSRFLAPPGNYLLFVISSSGVPSVAKIVQIG